MAGGGNLACFRSCRGPADHDGLGPADPYLEHEDRQARLRASVIVHGTGSEEAVLYAKFSPDGRRVVTAARDGKARIWELPVAPFSTTPVLHCDGASCMPLPRSWRAG